MRIKTIIYFRYFWEKINFQILYYLIEMLKNLKNNEKNVFEIHL